MSRYRQPLELVDRPRPLARALRFLAIAGGTFGLGIFVIALMVLISAQ